MTEIDELALIRKKKLEELMKKQQEAAIPKQPAVIEVFTSPTCPHCPRALEMANMLASRVPGIRVVEVSTAIPQGMAKAAMYNVQAVPMVFVNGKKAFTGAPPTLEALHEAVKKMSA
ncbi:MAG: thioredoxin family protein [Candidatus Methanoperedens sp.]|jgi:protein-disulfide isomerase|nr:thioredoxin family protein [Candidatus Methanoperedens sp.]PKL54309.1 MAG: glutaredoxin [Candidatus Methanoperedenaceae archaeon HGW-Methanoperedenaceae-1]